MQHHYLRLGGTQYLLCAPQATSDGKSTGYGNLLRHIEQAVRSAAALRATLFLIPPRRPLNAAVYDLDSPDVAMIGQADWRAPLLRLVWWLATPVRYGAPVAWIAAGAARRLRRPIDAAKLWARRRGWRALDRRLDALGHRSRDTAKAYADRTTDAWSALYAAARAEARATGSKRHRVRLQLRPDAQRAVDRLAAGAGLDVNRPIVTLHVRESGYRRREAQRQQDLDRLRDARIETYGAATGWLQERGYQVVRIGDPSMRPCTLPGVIDLATADWRTDAFELWALFQSRFFIASDSGPYFLAQLAGVPCLAVNVIQVGYYTLRSADRYVCKRVRDLRAQRLLGVAEMLTEAFIRNPLDVTRYEWLDNSDADIHEAVAEMIAALDAPGTPRTAFQEHHDALLGALSVQWTPAWRSRTSLLFRRRGPGTISPGFAARYLDPGGSSEP